MVGDDKHLADTRYRNDIDTGAHIFNTLDTRYRYHGASVSAKSVGYCRFLLACRAISRADRNICADEVSK
mgnify:CR=1 FL=1